MKEPRSLAALNRLIVDAAPMVKGGTRAVLGEGPLHPNLALVGEQPGDQEDIEGHPFVGPAGKLLNRALEEAGIDRDRVYVTNAVKHFKFEQRGKRRLHSKPNAGEVRRYRWWLEGTRSGRTMRDRGTGRDGCAGLSGQGIADHEKSRPRRFSRAARIYHHSSVFFIADSGHATRHRAFADFVADLKAELKLSTHCGADGA